MNETAQTTFSVPSPGELEQLTELHKAMGDYTRMRILWYLMQKDSCVSELAQKMEVTESAISHQLRALRIVRLVQSRKAGKSVILVQIAFERLDGLYLIRLFFQSRQHRGMARFLILFRLVAFFIHIQLCVQLRKAS